MSPDDFDVPACLDRVRRQDAMAARMLVDHFYPLVIKIVRSHRPRRMAEEDLAQEIYLKMFNRLAQYHGRDGVPFGHWLSRLAVTTCLDALRAEKRRPEWRWADLQDAEREWLEYFVEKLLALLPVEDRLVITLLDLEERSIAEISELTGWGKSMVKIRAFRARRKLRGHALKWRRQSRI
jgi:RNA polymerase sigma-70 factor (ECF subfamily)